MPLSHFDTLAALCVGLAFAGAVIEALACLTQERVGFDLFFRHGRKGMLAIPLLLMTGPVLVLRDAWRARRFGGSLVLTGGALLLGLAWSIASGHLLLILIALVHGAAVML